MQAVNFENVSFCYEQGDSAINNISLSIEQGEFVAIVGKNGSGKSTLAKLINCLLLPTSGKVTVFGMDTANQKLTFDVRKKVGMVFQNPDNQMVATIVEDDVAFGPENVGMERKKIGEAIDFALKVTDMEEYRNKPSSNLSGGQKQRIAIAGVLALKPQIIILDESTSMLDPKGREEIMQIVHKLNRENNVTVIAVTHYMDEVVNADKVYVINDGKVAFHGTPRQVFSMGDQLEKCGLCLPRATYIFNRLKDAGIVSGDIALNKEELIQRLCK